MKDLTKGSVPLLILVMSAPVAMTMVTYILYDLITLYFLLGLGSTSVAGAGAAGSAVVLITAVGQMLGAGTVSLVSQAVGRKDPRDANVVFNQSLLLAAILAVLTLVLFVVFGRIYLRSVAQDPATIDAGTTFLFWALPGWVCALPMSTLSGALRGTGIIRPTLIIYTATVILNMLLAPLLISGWATGVALGVRGAGLATSISSIVGVILLATYAHRSQAYLTMSAPLLLPRPGEWRRILRIGLPVGSELVLTFACAAVTLHAISSFGASAQAGFSIGQRILQVILVPGLSIAYAAGPIAGQNFGARKSERVREVFRHAAGIGTGIMLLGTILLQCRSQLLLSLFDADPTAATIAKSFLLLMSWTLVAQMLVYTCKIMFTGLGNTLPSLISSGMQFTVFSIPALWLSTQPDFHIEQIWYLLMGSITLQASFSLWLLRGQFRRRLFSSEA